MCCFCFLCWVQVEIKWYEALRLNAFFRCPEIWKLREFRRWISILQVCSQFYWSNRVQSCALNLCWCVGFGVPNLWDALGKNLFSELFRFKVAQNWLTFWPWKILVSSNSRNCKLYRKLSKIVLLSVLMSPIEHTQSPLVSAVLFQPRVVGLLLSSSKKFDNSFQFCRKQAETSEVSTRWAAEREMGDSSNECLIGFKNN